MKRGIFVLIFVMFSLGVGAQSFEVTPSYDSYVNFDENGDQAVNPGFQDLPYLHVGGDDKNYSMAILYFDITPSRVEEAELNLKLLKSYGSEGLVIGVHKINSFNAVSGTGLRYEAESYKTFGVADGEDSRVEITGLMQETNRILLKAVSNEDRKVFYSSESQRQPLSKPILKVRYDGVEEEEEEVEGLISLTTSLESVKLGEELEVTLDVSKAAEGTIEPIIICKATGDWSGTFKFVNNVNDPANSFLTATESFVYEYEEDLGIKTFGADCFYISGPLVGREEVNAIVTPLEGAPKVVLDYCPDFNNDEEVGPLDVILLALKYGNEIGDEDYDVLFDLNGDGRINFDDFLVLTGYFGDCDREEEVSESDYEWDVKAVRAGDESMCDNIENLELMEFCKYRVSIFTGTYSRNVLGFHVEIERSSDMNLQNLLAKHEVKEFSLDEYDGISNFDSKVVANGGSKIKSLLFVVKVPPGQRFAEPLFGINTRDVLIYRSAETGGFGEERLVDESDVFVKVREGGQEYIPLGEQGSLVPVIDGKISFIIRNSDRDLYPVVDVAFREILFGEEERDFSGSRDRLYREKLLPSGEYVSR